MASNLLRAASFEKSNFFQLHNTQRFFSYAGWWHRRCLTALENHKGVDDAFLPIRGFISIPPGDRRELGPKPFPAPAMYFMK
jgi:hypothetical protein